MAFSRVFKLASGVVLALLLGMVVASLGRGPSPAKAEGVSYVLTDFEIQYPYVEQESETSSKDEAGVRFTVSWAGGAYPGEATCEIALLASDGSVVGSKSLIIDAGSPSNLMSSSSLYRPIQVTGEPERAESTCGGGSYDKTAGYQFGDPTIEPISGGRSRISFPVEWNSSSGGIPGIRSCSVNATLADGSTETYGPYNLSVGDPAGGSLDLEPKSNVENPIVSATVECSDYGQ